jgi:CHRD domain
VKRRILVALALVGLLSGVLISRAGADTEVKFSITLTAVDPVTGQVTGDRDGRGTAEFTFDTVEGTVCYQLEVEGIAEPVEPAPGLGSAHIHTLASVPPGAIAVDLKADFQPDKSDEFKASGCVEVDSALRQAIVENPDQYYMNIHNVEFPGGALAGLLSG